MKNNYRDILVISALFILSRTVDGRCTSLPYPKPLKTCLDELNGYKKHLTGEIAVESCIRSYLWTTAKDRWQQPYNNETVRYLATLYDKYIQAPQRKRRQIFPGPPSSGTPCIRKEIRQLTETEYNNFINCVNRMKTDRRLSPNLYEAIAGIHNGLTATAAHGGQAFLGWHTLYTLLFEFSLRDCPGSPCLPYWDTTLDYGLPNPRDSIFFKLIGGTGRLESPFQNWQFETRFGQRQFVQREVADRIRKDLLISNDKLRELLSATTTHEMTLFSSPDAQDIETEHNGLHNFIGGTVANALETAPQDIIFFLLHSFIEYIFSENLNKMTNNLQVNAQGRLVLEYPRGPYRAQNGPNDVMGVLGHVRINNRFGSIENWEAYDFTPGSWRSHFQYAPRPTCSNNCQTPRNNLFCCNNECMSKVQVSGSNNNTVGIIPAEFDTLCHARRKRQVKKKILPYVEPERHIVQNDFVINGIPSKDQWVYIAVLITNTRPYGQHFKSYFVQHGQYEKSFDIYDASNCSSFRDVLKVGKARPYKMCTASRSGSSLVYVKTDGINYNGHYKDYAIIDDRFSVSESVTYVAVKRPTDGKNTEVIITANDECGRICRPTCEVKGSPGLYQSCNGVLRIDNKPPLMYGDTLSDIMAMHWHFSKDDHRPYSSKTPYCVNFVCDGTVDF